MKRIIFLLFLVHFFVSINARQPAGFYKDSALELRLKLIDESQGNEHDLVVMLSVINHLDKDVYVPSLGWQILSGIVVYKKSGENYQKISLTDSSLLGETLAVPKMTSFDQKYIPHFRSIFLSQSKVYDSYLHENPKNKELPIVSEAPLFIKANAIIEDYSMSALNKLLTEKGEYKIVFDYEKASSSPDWPSFMAGYKKLIPDNIIANTLYYSNL